MLSVIDHSRVKSRASYKGLIFPAKNSEEFDNADKSKSKERETGSGLEWFYISGASKSKNWLIFEPL
jgi:hypothetical protein